MKKCVANHTDDYLASRGLWRKPIANDGSSLFRAVAEQVFNTQAQHHKVREDLIKYMKRHKDKYKPMMHDIDIRIQKLRNPRESGGQFEIIVLSPMYKIDFFIINENDKDRNLTQNGYKKKILLCFSNSNHFDIIYPHSYTVSAAICQSIVYELLYERVFKMKDSLAEASQMINTKPERSWFHKAADSMNEGQRILSYEKIDDLCERECIESILHKNGIVEKRSPFPYKVAKALSPDIYRNVEYESWKEARNETHHRDFYPMKDFFPGDKCQVQHNGNLYNAHIQDMSPDKGPVSVFIEELGEKQTVCYSSLIRTPHSGGKERRYSSLLEENFDAKLKISKPKKKDQLVSLSSSASAGLSSASVSSPGTQCTFRPRIPVSFRGFCGRIGEYRQQINAAGHPVRKWSFQEGYKPRFPVPLNQKLIPSSAPSLPPCEPPSSQQPIHQVQGGEETCMSSSPVTTVPQDPSQIQHSVAVTLTQPPLHCLPVDPTTCLHPAVQFPPTAEVYEDPAVQAGGYLPIYQDGQCPPPQPQPLVMMLPVNPVDSALAPGTVDPPTMRYFFNLGVEYYKMSHPYGLGNQTEDDAVSTNGQFAVAKIPANKNNHILVKTDKIKLVVKSVMRPDTGKLSQQQHYLINNKMQELNISSVYKNSSSRHSGNIDFQEANRVTKNSEKTSDNTASLLKEPLSVSSQDSGCGDSDISYGEGLDRETTFDDSLDSLGCHSDSISPHLGEEEEIFRDDECSPEKQGLIQPPMRPIPARFRMILDEEAKQSPAQYPKRFEGQPLIRHKPLGNRKRKLARLAQMAQMLEQARGKRFEFNPDAESFTPTEHSLTVNSFQPGIGQSQQQNGLFILAGHTNTHMMAVPANLSATQHMVPINSSSAQNVMPISSSSGQPTVPANPSLPQNVVPVNSAATQNIVSINSSVTQNIMPINSSVPHGIVPVSSSVPHSIVPIGLSAAQNIVPVNSSTAQNKVPANSTGSQNIVHIKSSVAHYNIPSNTSPEQNSGSALSEVENNGDTTPQQAEYGDITNTVQDTAESKTTTSDRQPANAVAVDNVFPNLEDSLVKPDPAIIHIVRSTTNTLTPNMESHKNANIVKDINGKMPSNLIPNTARPSSSSCNNSKNNCINNSTSISVENKGTHEILVSSSKCDTQLNHTSSHQSYPSNGGINVNGTVYYMNPHQPPPSSQHPAGITHNAPVPPPHPAGNIPSLTHVPTTPVMYPQPPVPPSNPCNNPCNVVFVHPPPTGGASGQMAPACGPPPPPVFVPTVQQPQQPQHMLPGTLMPPQTPPSSQQPAPPLVATSQQMVMQQQPPPPHVQGGNTVAQQPLQPHMQSQPFPPQGTVYYGPVYQPLQHQQPCPVQYAPAVSGPVFSQPQYT